MPDLPSDDPAAEAAALVEDFRARGRAPFPADLPDRSPLLTGQPAAGEPEPRVMVGREEARPASEYVLPWQGARNGRELGAYLLGLHHATGKCYRADVPTDHLAGATGVLVAAGMTVRTVESDPANRRYVVELS